MGAPSVVWPSSSNRPGCARRSLARFEPGAVQTAVVYHLPASRWQANYDVPSHDKFQLKTVAPNACARRSIISCKADRFNIRSASNRTPTPNTACECRPVLACARPRAWRVAISGRHPRARAIYAAPVASVDVVVVPVHLALQPAHRTRRHINKLRPIRMSGHDPTPGTHRENQRGVICLGLAAEP